jgi:hypothetical protein
MHRNVKMKKAEVIRILEANKAKHLTDYSEAKVAFKKQALLELAKATKQIEKGSLELKVSLISPVSRKQYFDNVIGMFKNDVNTEVDLTQAEYNEYILDSGSEAVQAFMSNSVYHAGIRNKGR